MNAQHRDTEQAAGHPSLERLIAEQGTGPVADVSLLHGDFWPEEESMEYVLDTLREWRRHEHNNSAA